MASDERLIEDLAQAVVDGDPIDWASAESSAAGARPLVGHLRAVATVADVHRARTSSGDDGSSADRAVVPETWGHLRLLELIGRGAFGSVYRAWDTQLDREVALKLIPVNPEAAAAAASTLLHEGRLLARVRHSNVVTIYGADRIGEHVGMWMELVEGRTLEQLIRAGTVFDPSEAVRIGLELGEALTAVHEAGLLHRDVKPQNVMRGDDGRIVLMDFGTGRDVADGGSDLTGTPLYLAPEVFHGQPATERSDVYSLGVLLFHLLTRSYPVQGTTVREVRLAHESNTRTPLRTLRPHLPRALTRVIERAIDWRPESRYPSAGALCAALRKANRWSARRRVMRRSAAAASLALAAGWLAYGAGWFDAWLPGQRAGSTLAAVSGGRATPDATERPIIAVLPFKDLGNDPEGRLVADGLTYEIVGHLASIQGLVVRPATSSLDFRTDSVSLQTFARQRGANLVLEGSVGTTSGRPRVTAQLVRVADNATIWAASFDTAGNGVLAAQSKISMAIANNLKLRFVSAQRGYSTEPGLYNLFLQARALQLKRGPKNATRAAQLFESVIEADPDFVPAIAGLANTLSTFTQTPGGDDARPPDSRMEWAAREAVRRDPTLAEAQAAMGNLYAREHEWAQARASFRKAIELNPLLTTTHADFVLSTLLPLWKHDESLRVLDDALLVDPMSLDVRRTLALIQVETGQYEQAIENSRWVLREDPDYQFASISLGRALILSGRPLEARALPPFKGWGYGGYLSAVLGQREEAVRAAAQHPEAPSLQALIYATVGDTDRAFDALERLRVRSPWRAATWMIRPEMAHLRDDPRFAALRKRLRVLE